MTENKNSYFTGENALMSYANQSDYSENDDQNVVPRGYAKTMANRTFVNHDTNISVRSDYNRTDYEYFRPSDTVPKKQQEIIGLCMEAYQKVGLVRNVIDLMGDFGSQGIRLQHQNPSVQQFYNTWWQKVDGQERSERFLNQLYRCGQVIVRKSNGVVSTFEQKKWKRGVGSREVKPEKIKTNKNEIPLKYRFLNPLNLEVVGEDLAQFVGEPVLGLKINTKLRTAVSRALSKSDKLSEAAKKIISKIPKDILKAIKDGARVIPLKPEQIEVFYYKKDDWMLWANPMCYCVLDDILMLNKLKLADISALDGAISNIRLWKLGIIGDGPNNSILPTKSSINKLRNILANNVGGGTMDLVWGPELSFEESNSQVWRWLGSEKYQVTISAIYEGLGIPAPLRAGSGAGSTNTGNFVGLNTLIKRLQYGRDQLVKFWTKELKYIHKAMGFPDTPPQIIFDFMALADEAAERKLLIDLWDREIISDETIVEIFGRKPNVEKARVKKEMSDRTNEKMPYKASPFHNPDKEHEYRKILLQGGGVAPSEIGIDLNDRKPGEKTRIEQMDEVKKKYDPVGQPGRPNNITETTKRKQKPTEKPSTNASFINMFMWANSAQEEISHISTSSLLYSFGKKDIRSLSKSEFNQMERIKLKLLFNLEPFEEITSEKIYKGLSNNLKIDNEIYGIIKTLTKQFISKNNRQPNIEEVRQIYSSSYALYKEKV